MKERELDVMGSGLRNEAYVGVSEQKVEKDGKGNEGSLLDGVY